MADGISIREPKETPHWMQTPVPQHTQTKGAAIKTGTPSHYKIRVKRCSKTHRFFKGVADFSALISFFDGV